jgi:hypothetical protein
MVRHVRVVVLTQDVRRSLKGMMSDPPTPLGMTVDFTYAGIDTQTDGAYQGGLTEIRAESGPEVVVLVWSAMKGSRVECEPMTEAPYERDEERQSDDHEE